MFFQGAITTLVGTFISLYLGFAAIGRPDIPLKIGHDLRVKALAETRASGQFKNSGSRGARDWKSDRYFL